MEGEVSKIFEMRKLRERQLFLFNDLLVLASPQGNKKDKFTVKLIADLDQVDFYFILFYFILFYLSFSFFFHYFNFFVKVELVSSRKEENNETIIEELDPKEKELKAGIEKFNDDPKKGLEYLIKEEVIEDTPERYFFLFFSFFFFMQLLKIKCINIY